jgi:hypothetical protein
MPAGIVPPMMRANQCCSRGLYFNEILLIPLEGHAQRCVLFMMLLRVLPSFSSRHHRAVSVRACCRTNATALITFGVAYEMKFPASS